MFWARVILSPFFLVREICKICCETGRCATIFPMTVLKKIGIVCAGVMISMVASAQTWISTPDGVAGQAHPVRISGAAGEEILSAALTRPDGSVVRWQQFADGAGVAAASINSMHVRQAGAYQLAVTRGTGEVATSDFEIMPGVVSAFRSTVTAEKLSLAADGEQVSRVMISVRDAWDNPIEGVPVQIVSSRNVDAVVANPVTDARGQIVAQVRSAEAGVSTLAVLADGVEIFAKPELVFFLHGDRGMPAVGANGIGRFLKTQIFDDEPVGLPAAYFTLEQINAVETAGKDLTVQVVARDQNGEVVTDFAGTIRFSSSDDRATLPNDYVFTPSDQGVHTYYLAVKFGTPGDHTIAVHDLNDFRISGELEVDVKSGMAPISVPEEETSVSITFPVDGGASSEARVTIFGEANGCSSMTITDGAIELIAGLAVDSAGSFVYQTPRLADGYHEILATCDDDATVTSGVIRLKVDTAAPQVANVTVEPSGMVNAGDEVRVTVLGTEPLSAAQVIVDGFGIDLMPAVETPPSGMGTGPAPAPTEGDGMTFSGRILAPNLAGQYPITVVVVDDMGNRFETPTGGVINVSAAGEGDHPGGREDPKTNAVSNLYATSGEFKQSTLSWDAPSNTEGLTNYHIRYRQQGENEGHGEIDTTGVELGRVVEELEPGVMYVFEVTPVYGSGNGEPSRWIAGTPAPWLKHQAMNLETQSGQIRKVTLTWEQPMVTTGLQRYRINYGFEGQDLLWTNMTPGPRVTWYVEGLEPGVTYDFQVTPIYEQITLGIGSNVAPGTPADPQGVPPTGISNLHATSGEVEKVPLLWSPAQDDDGIGQYKIEYAVAGEPEIFAVFTPDDRTNFEVRSLEACVKYRFQVTAIDQTGLAGPTSPVAEGSPFCPEEKNMHAAAPATPQTGAADLLIPLFAVLAGVGAVMLLRKRAA